MEAFLIFIYIVFGILSLILFFKVWSACNAINRLADKYAPEEEVEEINRKKSSKSAHGKNPKFNTKEDIDRWLEGSDD